MSKLHTKYLELKKTKNIKYLFKSGIFYIFLDEDAKEISNILNLKLTNLNDTILKCGFPTNNLEKYINLLKKYNIEFEIIDQNLNKISSIDNYLNNEQINLFIDKIKKTDINSITPKQAYDILYDFSLSLKETEV